MGPLVDESRALCLLSFSEQRADQLSAQGSGCCPPALGSSVLALAGQHSAQGMDAEDFICCEVQLGLRRLFHLRPYKSDEHFVI